MVIGRKDVLAAIIDGAPLSYLNTTSIISKRASDPANPAQVRTLLRSLEGAGMVTCGDLVGNLGHEWHLTDLGREVRDE